MSMEGKKGEKSMALCLEPDLEAHRMQHTATLSGNRLTAAFMRCFGRANLLGDRMEVDNKSAHGI